MRVVSAAELADLRAMLATKGVAPVTDSVTNYCAQKTGRKAEGLWSFVASFRAEKKKPAKGKKKTESKATNALPGDHGEEMQGHIQPNKVEPDSKDSAAQTMVEMGFAVGDITTALEQASFPFLKPCLCC